MENSNSKLKVVCLVVLCLGSCAFAYSLGWQHGEAAGNQDTILRMESIASSVRSSQMDWDTDESGGASPTGPVAGAAKATKAAGLSAAAVSGSRTSGPRALPASAARAAAGPQAALDWAAN